MVGHAYWLWRLDNSIRLSERFNMINSAVSLHRAYFIVRLCQHTKYISISLNVDAMESSKR